MHEPSESSWRAVRSVQPLYHNLKMIMRSPHGSLAEA